MRADHNIRLLTSHGAVLLLLAHRSRMTAAELARDAGITQRQVLRVLSDLLRQEYVRVEIHGNRREYQVIPTRSLGARPGFSGLTVADLLPLTASLRKAREQGPGR